MHLFGEISWIAKENLYWIRTCYFKNATAKNRLNCFAMNEIPELLTYIYLFILFIFYVIDARKAQKTH